jgi:galactonate dehydratase
MKITGYKSFMIGNPWKRWVFLQMETSNGMTGLAEATLYHESASVLSQLKEKEKFFIGKDPFDIERIWFEWYRDSFSRNNSAVNITALSAVETACWDIVGKAWNTPVYSLLGGKLRDRVTVYANGWYTYASTPAEFAEKAKKVVQKGYRALKLDPFGTAYMTASSHTIKRSVEITEAVRNAVGEGVDLLIEGHGRFTPESAIRIAKLMESSRPRWFEEPVPPENISGLKQVKQKTWIPIAAGERILTKYGFAPLVESGCMDIIQPDIINTGGILETKKIAAIAESHLVTVAPHQAEGPLATATCLQLDACIPNFEIQESFDEFDIGWRKDLISPSFVFENGQLLIPNGPGLGVSLNMKSVEDHLSSDSQDFVLFEKGWENRNLPKVQIG